MATTKTRWPHYAIRHDEGDARYYGAVEIKSNTKRVVWYPSVTEVIRKTSPLPPGLLQWYVQHGLKEANKLKEDAAAKGTEMHIIFERYLRGEQIDMADLPLFHAKALLSLDQWANDNDVAVIATEQRVFNHQLRYAGTVDLICEMTFNKQRVKAIVDFKSGTGVYDDYAIQLEMYRLAWNQENRKTHDVTHVFNWSPKDWNKSPSYTLKNQTGVVSIEHVQHRCNLYHAAYNARPKNKMIITGQLPGDAKYNFINQDEIVFDEYRQHLGTKPLWCKNQLQEKFDTLTPVDSVSGQ